jgi:antitoxin component of MazEF toxin-antitoxin module
MATVVLTDGKLELPRSVRQQLKLNDGDTLELEVSGDAIVLRPTDEPTPEEREHIRRGLADASAGRVRQVTEEELLALIDPADRP